MTNISYNSSLKGIDLESSAHYQSALYNWNMPCTLSSVAAHLFMSGQVRSECLTCSFRASCCSARLLRVQEPAFAGSSVQDRKKRGREGKSLTRAVVCFLCISDIVFLHRERSAVVMVHDTPWASGLNSEPRLF